MSAHRDSILMRMENVNVSKVAFYKANIYTHKCFPNIACYPVLVANCTVIRGEGKVIVALDLQNYLSTDILPYSTHCSIYAANNIYCNAAVTKEVDKSGGFSQSNTHLEQYLLVINYLLYSLHIHNPAWMIKCFPMHNGILALKSISQNNKLQQERVNVLHSD